MSDVSGESGESLESKLRRVQSAAMSDEDAMADIDIVSIIRDAITNRDRVAELEGERVRLQGLVLEGGLGLNEKQSKIVELQAQLDSVLARARVAATVDVVSPIEAFDIVERAMVQVTREKSEVQAQLDRANGELGDERFLHQRAHAALLRLNMQLGADALGEEVGESILEDCNADREKWARMSTARFGPSGNPQADRATKPQADVLANCTHSLRHALYWPDHTSCDRGWAQLIDDTKDIVRGLSGANERIGELQALSMAAESVLRHEPTKPRHMSEAPVKMCFGYCSPAVGPDDVTRCVDCGVRMATSSGGEGET